MERRRGPPLRHPFLGDRNLARTDFRAVRAQAGRDELEAKIGGGEVYEVAFSRIKNPVSGEEEELYLDKPTGFTSKRAELGMTTISRFSLNGLTYDNSGKYGEYSKFEYAGG